MGAWGVIGPRHHVVDLDILTSYPVSNDFTAGVSTEHRDCFDGAAEVKVREEVDVIAAGDGPYAVASLGKILSAELQELLVMLLDGPHLGLIATGKVVAVDALGSEDVGDGPAVVHGVDEQGSLVDELVHVLEVEAAPYLVRVGFVALLDRSAHLGVDCLG